MNRHAWILGAVLGTLTMGCPSDDGDDLEPTADTEAATTDASADGGAASTGSGAEETGEASTGGGNAALYDCSDPDLQVARPLSGPGYDPELGLLEPVQDTYVVHTTQLYVNPDADSQAEFFQLIASINAQLENTEGFVALSLAVEPNCGFNRTLGVWRSQADMNRFVTTGAHATAMGRTLDISTTGKTTSWEASADEMPTWADAAARLDAIDESAIYD